VNRSVLLIDDNAVFREGITAWFEGTGYTFFEADGPSEGVRMLAANPQIQVVVLDLEFPDDDVPGMGVLDFVHERPDQYRAIILTAHEELMDADQALARDVFHYLPKSQHFAAIRFSLDQAFNDLERAALARKIRFLQEVQQRINAGDDITKILDLICESVREIVGAYTCHIRVYDFKGGDFHLTGFAPDGSLRDAFNRPRAKGEIFSGEVVKTGRPTWYDDLQYEERFLAFKHSTRDGRTLTPGESEYWNTVSSAYIVPISTGLFDNASKAADSADTIKPTGTVDAVLNVSSQSTGFFDEDKRALVDEFVSQASLAITKDWLQRKRDELHQDYRLIGNMLGNMRERLAGPDVQEELYHTVTENLADLVSAEVVSIFLYNERTGLIENVAEYRGRSHVSKPDEVYRLDQSFVGKVFKEKKTRHLQSSLNGIMPLEDPTFDHSGTEQYTDIIPSGVLEHYLGVPIRAGEKTQGVLRVMNKKSSYYDDVMGDGRGTTEPEARAPAPPNRFCLLERGFSRDCRNVVEITASHLAIAIQNARLIEGRNQRLQQLQTLGEVGRLMNSELDIQTVLEQTIHAMAMVMQAEICLLFLREPSGGRVVLKQCFGIPEDEIAGASYELGEGLTGTAAASGRPRLIRKAGENDGKYDARISRFLTRRDGRLRAIESLMVVPITAKSVTLGVMKVINKVGHDPHYRAPDLRLFQAFGQYVSVAVANANSYESTNQRLADAQRNAVLSSLVRAVAHEINNTAGLIPANVEMIQEELGPVSPAVDDMLRLIDDVAKQATEFANEITGFSKRGPQREEDLNGVIRHALRELPRSAGAARLTTSLCDEPLVCAVFENPFKQIVRNIVINAVQALEGTENGEVTVSSAKGEGPLAGWAVLQFTDNGPGIPPENLERIFQLDFTTNKPSGNGIGLWLVQQQLNFMGGEIDVANERGAGARFTVRMRLAPREGEAAVP
jgi:signal transduction histidine kinase/CheY-like chemotaxis protein